MAIKTIQLFLCILLLGITVYLFNKWKKEDQSVELMRIVKLLISMHFFDLATFLIDMVMVLKRWRFMIAMRFILSSISFAIGIVIQVAFT